MSNLASDHDDYTTDPRCTCRTVHGNADDDGICRHCYRKALSAMKSEIARLQARLQTRPFQDHGEAD